MRPGSRFAAAAVVLFVAGAATGAAGQDEAEVLPHIELVPVVGYRGGLQSAAVIHNPSAIPTVVRQRVHQDMLGGFLVGLEVAVRPGQQWGVFAAAGQSEWATRTRRVAQPRRVGNAVDVQGGALRLATLGLELRVQLPGVVPLFIRLGPGILEEREWDGAEEPAPAFKRPLRHVLGVAGVEARFPVPALRLAFRGGVRYHRVFWNADELERRFRDPGGAAPPNDAEVTFDGAGALWIAQAGISIGLF